MIWKEKRAERKDMHKPPGDILQHLYEIGGVPNRGLERVNYTFQVCQGPVLVKYETSIMSERTTFVI